MKPEAQSPASLSAQHSTEHGSISLCHGEVIHLLLRMLERQCWNEWIIVWLPWPPFCHAFRLATKVPRKSTKAWTDSSCTTSQGWFGLVWLQKSDEFCAVALCCTQLKLKVNSWLTHAQRILTIVKIMVRQAWAWRMPKGYTKNPARLKHRQPSENPGEHESCATQGRTKVMDDDG